MPCGYNSTQGRPLPWLEELVWPGGLCPFGSVTGQAVDGVGACGLCVPSASVGTGDPLAAGSSMVSWTGSAVHEASSNATTTTTPRTHSVHRATGRGFQPRPPRTSARRPELRLAGRVADHCFPDATVALQGSCDSEWWA